MRFLKNSLILACISLLVFSCKNDLELNAPYKEVPSIYAVLNPYESTQMIRINKVFLGEGDANQMAKVADSVNYAAGDLLVTLDRFSNGVQIDACPKKGMRTIVFKESTVETAPGAFNSSQRVYGTDEDLKDLTRVYPQTDSIFGDYVLTVKNLKTGNVFTAKASAIKRVNPNQGYQPLSPPYRPYAPGTQIGYVNYSAVTPSITVGSILFQPVENAKIYQLVIRSHFYNDLAVPTFDYVDYVFNDPRTLRNLSNVSYINVTFKSSDYFNNLGLGLSRKNLPDVGKKMFAMEYFVYASTQEYMDYLEFVKPSLSLNQNKPFYSNFENKAALGIFTFRSTCVVEKELDAVFVNAISTNANTCKYKFYDFSGRINSCR